MVRAVVRMVRAVVRMVRAVVRMVRAVVRRVRAVSDPSSHTSIVGWGLPGWKCAATVDPGSVHVPFLSCQDQSFVVRSVRFRKRPAIV